MERKTITEQHDKSLNNNVHDEKLVQCMPLHKANIRSNKPTVKKVAHTL